RGLLTWKPKLVVSPGASVPLWLTLLAVTVWPLVVTVAFQAPVRVCPAGRVKVTVQLVIVEVLVLVMVSGWITYPFSHWDCTVGVAEQAPVVPPWGVIWRVS